MPRNLRNFWIDTDVDGRASKVGTGPASKDGGFDTNIYIRDGGRVEKALTIYGTAHADGSLTLRVVDPKSGTTLHQVERHRDRAL